jgi:hypothetical protein
MVCIYNHDILTPFNRSHRHSSTLSNHIYYSIMLLSNSYVAILSLLVSLAVAVPAPKPVAAAVAVPFPLERRQICDDVATKGCNETPVAPIKRSEPTPVVEFLPSVPRNLVCLLEMIPQYRRPRLSLSESRTYNFQEQRLICAIGTTSKPDRQSRRGSASSRRYRM